MDLPDSFKKQAFRALLKQGFAFRKRGTTPFQSNDYHIFVVLNYDPSSGNVLLLVNGTSKVEKRLDYLRRVGVDADSTTVVVAAGAYPFTPKKTIFDCNTVHEINVNDISFSSGEIRFLGDQLSEKDINRIIKAVLASNNISEDYRRIISGGIKNIQ